MRVLILKDEAILALDLAMTVEEAGMTVLGPCYAVAAAMALLEAGAPDFAILDYNLAGETSTPVADRLCAAGIPFVFLTGNTRSVMPERFAEIPFLEKPLSTVDLQRHMRAQRDRILG